VFQGVILAALVALAVTRLDFRAVADAFLHADYGWLAAALALLVVGRAIHAYELRLTLRKVGKVPFAGFFGAFLIGNFINSVAPARAGDLARLQILSNRYGLSRTGMIVGQGAESIVDLVILVTLGMISLALLQMDLGAPRLFWFLAALVLIGFVALAVLSRFLPSQFSAVPGASRLPQRIRVALAGLWPSIHDGLESLRDPWLLAGTVTLNTFGWLLDLLVLGAFGLAFGLDIPYSAYLSVMVATSLLSMFPITPGNAGTFEFVVVRVLALYGVGSDGAFAFALAVHVFSTVATFVLGLAGMLFMRVSFQEVFAWRRAAAAKDGTPTDVPPVPAGLP
jgi:glycosyltransferase 2 family protein